MTSIKLTLRKYDNFVKLTKLENKYRDCHKKMAYTPKFLPFFSCRKWVVFSKKIVVRKTIPIVVKIISNLKKIISNII